MLKHVIASVVALAGATIPAPFTAARPARAVDSRRDVISLRASAADKSGSRFLAQYDARVTAGGVDAFLWVYVQGYPAGATFPLTVNGKVIGRVSTNKFGVGEAKFRSYPGTNLLPRVSSYDILGAGPLKAYFH